MVILERLVDLHDRRVAEEATGAIQWLRPSFQRALFEDQAARLDLEEDAASTAAVSTPTSGPAVRVAWPPDIIAQIAALRGVVGAAPVTVDEAAAAFDGAKRDLVQRHLETLALMGELTTTADGRFLLAPALV